MPAASFGFGNYRRWSVPQNGRSYHVPTTKVYPGDGVSPPVGTVTDIDAGRVSREEAEHHQQRATTLRIVQREARRYLGPAAPDSGPVVLPSPRNGFDVDVDPRN